GRGTAGDDGGRAGAPVTGARGEDGAGRTGAGGTGAACGTGAGRSAATAAQHTTTAATASTAPYPITRGDARRIRTARCAPRRTRRAGGRAGGGAGSGSTGNPGSVSVVLAAGSGPGSTGSS